MDEQIVAIDGWCDDVLKTLDHDEDPHRPRSTAQVMTTAVVAALHLHGHWERARELLSGGYIPARLGNSRVNRRLPALRELFLSVFQVLGEFFNPLNTQSVYGLASFPSAACDTLRLPRADSIRTQPSGATASANGATAMAA